MTAISLFIRTFWKPLAVLMVLISAYGYGYSAAHKKCNQATLKAENKELHRQLKTTQKILRQTADDASIRESKNQTLTKKVEEYENSISNKPPFILDDVDARRLRHIR